MTSLNHYQLTIIDYQYFILRNYVHVPTKVNTQVYPDGIATDNAFVKFSITKNPLQTKGTHLPKDKKNEFTHKWTPTTLGVPDKMQYTLYHPLGSIHFF